MARGISRSNGNVPRSIENCSILFDRWFELARNPFFCKLEQQNPVLQAPDANPVKHDARLL